MDALLNFLAPILAVTAAALSVAVTVWATYMRAKAEQHYQSILWNSDNYRRLRELHAQFLADGHLSDDELSTLTKELEAIALRLKRQERQYIIGALTQSSQKGRERYVGKVLTQREDVALA